MFIRSIVAVMIFVTVIGINTYNGDFVCEVSASHGVNAENYCFETNISIENSGVTDLTDKQVRVLINAESMINAGQLENNSWDFTPIQGSFINLANYMAQDLDSSNAPYWVVVNDLPANSERDIRVLSGSSLQRSDNGFYFNGANSAFIAGVSSTDLGLTGTSGTFEIVLTVTDLTARDESILSRHNFTDSGYQINLDSGGGGNVRLELFITGSSCFVEIDDTNRNVWRAEYSAAAGTDITWFKNDVSVATCDTDVANFVGTVEDFRFGDHGSLDDANNVVLHRLIIDDDSGVEVLHMNFNPSDLTELTAVDPTYTGTIEDNGVNGYDLAYTIVSDQSDLNVNVSATGLSTVSNFPPVSNNPAELFNGPFDQNFFIQQPTPVAGIIQNNIITPLDAAAASGGYNSDGPKVAMALAIGLGLAFLLFKFAPFPPLIVVAFCTPIGISSLAGWHNPVWALTTIVGAPLIWWGLTKMQETSVSS